MLFRVLSIYFRFVKFVVTETDQTLKKLALEKTSYYPNRNSSFSSEVEYYLVKLFEKEIEIIHILSKMTSEIKLRYDFNQKEMFYLLDENHLNYITSEKYSSL